MDVDPTTRHRLLQRQLRAASRHSADGSLDIDLLLGLVSQAYQEQEETHRHNNDSIELVSREITELNRQLRVEADARARDAARLKALLEYASEAVVCCDDQAVIRTFNRAAEQMFGWTAEEAVGQSVTILYADWETALPVIRDALAAGGEGAPVEMELPARRKSGEVFPRELSLSFLDFEGEHLRIGFHRDISARKVAETALMAARDEAEAANRAKSEFLAAMSHEIRTPLNGVLGMAAALESTPLAPEQRRMLGVINESGQILMTLLSDILDLSKIEAGRMVLEETPFDLGASVHAVARLYGETASAKGLDYAVRIAADTDGWIVGDPTRYRQVLQNLVSNALKFTETGAVEIAVEAASAPDGAPVLRTSVSDTGLGISAEASGRLFSKFSQADASTTRRYGGTGLGLSISKQLVEALGGEIGVDSVPGHGSRFWFTLPLRRAEAPVEAPEVRAPGVDVRRSALRILAAEDNATNQLVLKAILGQADVEVCFADNGAVAVELARDQDFDIILMDVQMPVMDGISAARAIRGFGGRRGAVPIVAVTADAMPEQISQCLAAGMDGHVSKPFRPDNLFSVIDEAVNRQRPALAASA